MNNYLVVEIKDNGHGIFQTQGENKMNKKSLGMKISEQRISAQSKQQNGPVVHIEEIYHNGKVCGSLVRVNIELN